MILRVKGLNQGEDFSRLVAARPNLPLFFIGESLMEVGAESVVTAPPDAAG
ncbi:MAG: hypothetical protein V2B18_03100 [Pseudomonadota bacterium]